MPDPALLDVLRGGVSAWNQWREAHPGRDVNFSGVSLYGFFDPEAARYKGAVTPLRGIDFSGVSLRSAFMESVDLTGADLRGADLEGAILTDAVLASASLEGANLRDANLRRANLGGANLREANLMYAQLVGTDLSGADLTDCNIYGIAAWKVRTDEHTRQNSLYIRNYNEATIRVPGLDVAQFIYLLQDHRNLRQVLRAVSDRAVLLLGRFTDERKAILDGLADRLQGMGYMPIIFDFLRLPDKDFTETIITLAGLSRFIIADITQPKSIPQETQAIVPNFKMPLVPIMAADHDPWSMFKSLEGFDWVLTPVRTYRTLDGLLARLPELVDLAETKHRALTERKSDDTIATEPLD